MPENTRSPGRSDADGQRKFLPDKRGCELKFRDVDQISRQQLIGFESRLVVPQAKFVVAPAFNEVKRRVREPALGESATLIALLRFISFLISEIKPAPQLAERGFLRAIRLRIPWRDLARSGNSDEDAGSYVPCRSARRLPG